MELDVRGFSFKDSDILNLTSLAISSVDNLESQETNINNFQQPYLLQIFCNSLRIGLFIVVWGKYLQ